MAFVQKIVISNDLQLFKKKHLRLKDTHIILILFKYVFEINLISF